MKHVTYAVHDPSVHVPAGAWPETAAATTDGSGLAVDNGNGKRHVGWPEAAAFTTDVSAFAEDLRR